MNNQGGYSKQREWHMQRSWSRSRFHMFEAGEEVTGRR